MSVRRVIVLGCVKTKRAGTWPARDLYTSPLWHGRRAYAEAAGVPWFIFSAKYGLLAPDDVVASYELKITTLSAAERRALGRRVVEDLERQVGPLSGVQVEVHAGQPYVDAIRDGLTKCGAEVRTPVAGIVGVGAQIRWYVETSPRTPARDGPRPGPPRSVAGRVDATPAPAARLATGKYAALTEHLGTLPHPAHVSFAEIDRVVGGLPKSASVHPEWWANHLGNTQAKGWLGAGRKVVSVDLGRRVVEFS